MRPLLLVFFVFKFLQFEVIFAYFRWVNFCLCFIKFIVNKCHHLCMDSCLLISLLHVSFKAFRFHTTTNAFYKGTQHYRDTKGSICLPLCLSLSIALLVVHQHVGPPVPLCQSSLSHLRKSCRWVGCGPLSVSVSVETSRVVERLSSRTVVWRSVCQTL